MLLVVKDRRCGLVSGDTMVTELKMGKKATGASSSA